MKAKSVKISLRNIGKPHQVRCCRCGLKLECKCLFYKSKMLRDTHSIVACPRCQMTTFLNLLFNQSLARPTQLDLAQKYFIDAAMRAPMRARRHARAGSPKRR